METKIRTYFDDIIQQAEDYFEQVEHEIDTTPARAILRLKATHKQYRMFATEIKSPDYRKYNYYLLEMDFVVVGFDNAPDARAIKLKYDKIPQNDVDKLVPHQHLENKTILKLTEEIYFSDFIAWLKENLEE
ncbi:MAG: hypothetical protein AAGG68_16280 [Bacteroidota bacterium]